MVIPHFDLHSLSQEIIEFLKLKRDKEEEKKDADALIVTVLSHGGKGAVYGTDGREISITDMATIFYSGNCPSLKGKPKIFLIEACQDLGMFGSSSYLLNKFTVHENCVASNMMSISQVL